MGDGRVKVTVMKPDRRSRGRAATRTFTILRGLRDDVERADLLGVLALLVPLLDGEPLECRYGDERFRVERVERRRDHGVSVERAHFVGESEMFREHARRRRRLRRAEKRAREGELRALHREISARIAELYIVRRAAAPSAWQRLASLYPPSRRENEELLCSISGLSPRALRRALLALDDRARGAPHAVIYDLGSLTTVAA